MDAPGWLSQCQADVPSHERWLGVRERVALAALAVEPRRASWLLGRWTAKQALHSWLGVSAARVQILAAADGAPEAWLDERRMPVSLSISHRAGRGLATVADSPITVGCDLELIEPRSDAFIREWLGPAEQQLVYSYQGVARDLAANLIWTAKEAAAKVRREGLRLDLRRAVASVGEVQVEPDCWCPLEVRWGDGTLATSGWWRADTRWVIAVAAAPAPAPPIPLVASAVRWRRHGARPDPDRSGFLQGNVHGR